MNTRSNPRFFLNLSLYILTFLSGAYLFSTTFTVSRKLLLAEVTFFSSSFQILGQSISKQPNAKFSRSKFDQSLSKTLDLSVEGGSANVLGQIRNYGWLSKIVAVILPEIMSFEITLLKILSIRVLKWLLCRLGWIIYGKWIQKFICWFMFIIMHQFKIKIA